MLHDRFNALAMASVIVFAPVLAVAQTPGDSDGDGLYDYDEVVIYGTDPFNPDTDWDGMPDGWEVWNGLNPLDPNDAYGDLDSDWLYNLEEYWYGSDPNYWDSDGDWLWDFEEVYYFGTNPEDTDSDDDSLSDYDEVYIIGTSPTNPDTDGDGLLDGEDPDPLTPNLDSDQDGLQDPWEMAIFGSLSEDGPGDPDEDGAFNAAELAYGTDPLAPDTDEDGLADAEDEAPNVSRYTIDQVWVDDAIPAGSVPYGDSEWWTWKTEEPRPVSGSAYHESAAIGWLHQHFFMDAPQTIQVNPGDVLTSYVYLDPSNLPSEVMLQWLATDGTWWHHRAYWGPDIINWWGPRTSMGALPAAGRWVRLEVPASAVDLEGRTISGMAFTLYGGRASWDCAGKHEADADSDGLTNAQESSLGLNASDEDTDDDGVWDGDEDTDGDLLSNRAELLVYGSNPAVPNSMNAGESDGRFFAAASPGNNSTLVRMNLSFLPGGLLKLTLIDAPPDSAYDIYITPSFNPGWKWTLWIQGVVNQTVFIAPIPPGSMNFFIAGAASDADEDGLNDGYECLVSGSNLNTNDSDGDDLTDGWESVWGFDPMSPAGDDGGTGDPDGDGVPNVDEQTRGSDPLVPDPVITGMSPQEGPVSTVVTIMGNHFGGSVGTVSFNGVPAEPTSWTDTSITVEVPAGATTGPVFVTGGGITSIGLIFTVTKDPTYTVTHLGHLGGGWALPSDVNSHGDVVGMAPVPPNAHLHAFFYTNGAMVDLGTLGGQGSGAQAINDDGIITGFAQTAPSGTTHAFIHAGAGLVDIHPPGNVGISIARDINSSGQVTGSLQSSGSEPHAFRYSGGVFTDLGVPFGAKATHGMAINDAGQVAGYIVFAAEFEDTHHAFLWDPSSGYTDLGVLPGNVNSEANALNSKKLSAGWSGPDFNTATAVVFGDMRICDLGTLPGFSYAEAYGINATGQVVGRLFPGAGFLYSHGVMQNLNDLIDPNAGWTLAQANDISDTGFIVGDGTFQGQSLRAFLMTPADPTIVEEDISVCTPTYPTPANPVLVAGHDWSMFVEVSPDDGLVLREVKLGTRYMAERISLPYFYLKTRKNGADFLDTFGELTPDGDAPLANSRIVDYHVALSTTRLLVRAIYMIEKLGEDSTSSMVVRQEYEFYPLNRNERSEISGVLKAQRFNPIVRYEFRGNDGETLFSFRAPQRFHFQPDFVAGNSVAYFRDTVFNVNSVTGGIEPATAAHLDQNPLLNEVFLRPIVGGVRVPNSMDNMHQTWSPSIDRPIMSWSIPGCAECVHVHWRWFNVELICGAPFNGQPIIRSGSTQNLEVGTVVYAAGEEDPRKSLGQNWQALVNGAPLAGQNLVFWYEGEGTQASDSFFTHGLFFAPTLDVTSRVQVTQVSSVTDTQSNRTSVVFNVLNTSTTEIPGPISLVINGLSPNATVVNATGTLVTSPTTPFVNAKIPNDRILFTDNNMRGIVLKAGYLPPGQTATVRVVFQTNGAPFSYTRHVLAGQGAR